MTVEHFEQFTPTPTKDTVDSFGKIFPLNSITDSKNYFQIQYQKFCIIPSIRISIIIIFCFISNCQTNYTIQKT